MQTKVAGPYTTDHIGRSLLIEFDGSNNPIYMGWAKPGSLTSAAVWQIRKITFDGSNNPTAFKFAGGNADYANVWDNRAGLSYS